jgi:hypothetical protein
VLSVAFTLAAFQSTFASSFDSEAQKQVINKTFIDDQKNPFKVRITAYHNQHNELEVRLEASELPEFTEHINPILGFGRDVDGNDKIDTWFLITDHGIKTIRREGYNIFGIDVLDDILKKQFKTTFEMYVSSVANSLFSYLSWTVEHKQSFQEEYYQSWMDLEEARIHFETEMTNSPIPLHPVKIKHYEEMIKAHLKELTHKMDNFYKTDLWSYAAVDVGIFFTGAQLIKGFGSIFAHIAILKIPQNQLLLSVQTYLLTFVTHQKKLIEERLGSFNHTAGNVATKSALKMGTTKISLSQFIKAQRTKNFLLSGINKIIPVTKEVFKNAASEWKYIGLNAGVQAGAEFFARYDEVYDANPLKMAHNFLSNKDVQKNLQFMTTETFFMTGLSKRLNTLKGRYLASGAFSLANSSINNIILNDHIDMDRVAMDTAWEVIIGNSQVQADLFALESFEKLSLSKNNPKIKLVGYMLTLVDMGAGYYIYSEITTKLEESQNKQLMHENHAKQSLIHNHSRKPNLKSKEQPPQWVLLPVFAKTS